MRGTHRNSPSSRLMETFDFRVESLQQMMMGQMMPIERRLEILQQRRAVLSGDLTASSSTQPVRSQPSAESDSEDENVSSDETDENDQEDSEQDSQPGSIPSMSEAAGIKMGAQEQ